MPDSKARAFVHFVWATKGRRMSVPEPHEGEMYRIIEAQVNRLGCRVIAVNGVADHVHLLVQLSRTVSLAELMNQVKGVSSRFLNDCRLREGHPDDFRWQPGYGAFTLGGNQVPAAAAYVRRQKQRHAGEGRLWPGWEDTGGDDAGGLTHGGVGGGP